MMGSLPENVPTVEEAEQDSEWEYEYHETETEVFYVTLDISAAADSNKLGSKRKRSDTSAPKLPHPTASFGPQDNAGPTEQPETPMPETSAPMDIDQTPEQPEEDTSFAMREDRIQILDLHTPNPLISYQNQLYSCEWTSTLGTDVLLTAPTPDFPHPILREQPNVSVLATSSIKLMGRPAQISSRHTAEETSTPASENPTTASATNTSTPSKAAATATPIKIPIGLAPTRARQNQANFLERLIAIKAKKGEKDSVTVYTQKVNQGTGWRSQRKAMEDAAGGETTTPQQQQSETQTGARWKPTIGRPRGSRRTRGPRTAKGGLFRDYRPQLWDTPGADIRAGASTPESWDQLEEEGDGRASAGQRQTPTSPSLPAEQAAAAAAPVTSPTVLSSFPPPAGSVNGGEGEADAGPVSLLELQQQPAVVRDEDEMIADVEMDDG